MNLQPHSSAPSPPPSGARERGRAGTQGSEEIAITGRFSRCAKLLRHGDFQRVYKQGRRHFGTHMTVFYLERAIVGPAAPSWSESKVSGPKIGFTVSRALGGAVHRNRIRRRMREAVRDSLLLLTAPVDVVINPKKSAETAELQVLRAEVARAFGVIQEYETKSRRKS